MRPKLTIALVAGLLFVALVAPAQPPGGKGGKEGGKSGKGGESRSGDVNTFVARLMAFNAKKDGKLTKAELTDERLHALFDRADANKDGEVTREELVALYEKEIGTLGTGRRGPDTGGQGPGGKGKGPGETGPGGPGGRGPGGPSDGGSPGPGDGAGPQAARILPDFLNEMLQLSPEQKKKLVELQKEVDAQLTKLLTDEQKKQLNGLRDRGPGGTGGPPGDRRRPSDRPGP